MKQRLISFAIVLAAASVAPSVAFAQVASQVPVAPGTPPPASGSGGPNGAPQAPVDPITGLPAARAAGQAAAQHMTNVRDALTDYVQVQRLLFDNSPEYREAVAEHRKAYVAWVAARDEAMATLAADADYAEARKLRDSYGRQLETERARPIPDQARIGALSELRLSIGRQLSGREAELLNSDETVVSAKKSLVEAYAKVGEVRRVFEIKLRTSPELAAGRQMIRLAEEQQAYATTNAVETARVAEVLMHYAYYTQWLSTFRPYVITTPYYPYYGGFGGAAPVTQVGPGGGGGIGFGIVPGQ